MCDDGPVESRSTRLWRKARKAHRCTACHETITPGTRYHYSSGILDGSAFTEKHCARCWAMINALWRENPGMAVDFDLNCGEIWENPPDDVAALAFALPSDFAGAP